MERLRIELLGEGFHAIPPDSIDSGSEPLPDVKVLQV